MGITYETYDNWRRQLQFFADLVELFNIGEDGTKVSVLTYDVQARLAFPLNSFNNLADIQQAILNIPYNNGPNSNIPEALYQADVQCFSAANGNRPDADNMIIIGVHRNVFPAYRRDPTLQMARGLRNKGVKIAVVGIEDVDESFLQGLSFMNNYFRVPDFLSLRTLPQPISEPLCRAAETGEFKYFLN